MEELHMIIREAVDISHPAVQKLIGAGFSEEKSIAAIEKYETVEDATDYLIAMQSASEFDWKMEKFTNKLWYVSTVILL